MRKQRAAGLPCDSFSLWRRRESTPAPKAATADVRPNVFLFHRHPTARRRRWMAFGPGFDIKVPSGKARGRRDRRRLRRKTQTRTMTARAGQRPDRGASQRRGPPPSKRKGQRSKASLALCVWWRRRESKGLLGAIRARIRTISWSRTAIDRYELVSPGGPR